MARSLLLIGLLVASAYAQSKIVLTGTNPPLSLEDPAPTDPSLFTSLSSTITVSSDATPTSSSVGTSTAANETLIISGDVTATTTGDGPQPTNTRPCNGHPLFCDRAYSNITMIAAHNSPFVRPGSIASNQKLDVTAQLNDGVRMLQFQTHEVDGVIRLCHTSCDLLDAGSLEDYLTTVAGWLKEHPYDVVTILIGNADVLPPQKFADPIKNSGLKDYAYEPPKIPMSRDDWPTLGSMILSNTRAVIFMDYEANQSEVPYILDEFTQMWETPFSPTDRDFPCTIQRPPGLSPEDARDRMYMANHNLNTEVSLMGSSLLVPNTVLLNETNAVTGFGSLGAMARNCTADWGVPPNFLLVDYYNIGSYNGSVFEVAANMNNVSYDGECCGGQKSAATRLLASGSFAAGLSVLIPLLLGL